MMRAVLHVEAGELKVVVDATINEMPECGNRVRDFENPHAGPQLVSIVDAESWRTMSVSFLDQFELGRGVIPSVLTKTP
jgi:hypothetical protein